MRFVIITQNDLMSIKRQKIKLLLLQMEYKLAEVFGSLKLKQQMLEYIVITRTGIKVAEETESNNILFKSIRA
ncbi:MAG: hypothetical protein JWO06_3236 [Bacteroidota bacterium]|nr:hypothetical protein [Bacteroidota bacterium]